MAKEDNTTKKEVKKEKKVAVKKPAVKKAATEKKVVKKTVAKKPAVKKVEVAVTPEVVVTPKTTKETIKKEEPKASKTSFTGKYISAIGRRKTAIARVRLFADGKNQIIVNQKDYRDYFQVESMQSKVREPIDKMKLIEKFDVSVVARGGGVDSQAEAVCHGIARALVKLDETLKKRLRKEGLLTRDSRMKERKKPGLKRARKAPRWSKR